MFCVNVSTSTNYLSQRLVSQVIKKKKLIKNHKNQLTLQRNYFLKKYKNILKYNYPEGGIYLFLKIPKNFKNDIRFSNFLIKKYGIATIPGSSFGSAGRKYIRINYSNKRKDVEKFLKIYSSFK